MISTQRQQRETHAEPMPIRLEPGSPRTRRKEVYYPSSDGKPMAETDVHRQLMFDFIDGLKNFLRARQAYVSGNNFVYYEEGDPKKRISPDCYVVFGVTPDLRDNYKFWEEGGRAPDVVFEFTSRKTRAEDVRIKRPLYEQVLKVKEYFQFDPTGDYLKPRMQGFRLVDSSYQPIELVDDRMHSEQLGLDLVVEGVRLRMYDPAAGEWILTAAEQSARADEEAARARNAEQRFDEEARKVRVAEQRAEEERRRAERLAERLRAAGIEP